MPTLKHAALALVLLVTAMLGSIGSAAASDGVTRSIPLTCGTQHGGVPTNGNPNPIAAVRLGHHTGFDRFVVEFQYPTVPAWTVTPKSSANFTRLPSQLPATLRGTSGIRLDFFVGTQPAYRGQTDIVKGYPQLAQARELQDFEGYETWGLGLNHQSCRRILTLASPARLAIDVPN